MGEFNGSIQLISGILPKNGGSFPLVRDQDVLMEDGRRLRQFAAQLPTVDATLTQSGKAADAETVGQAFSQVSGEFTRVWTAVQENTSAIRDMEGGSAEMETVIFPQQEVTGFAEGLATISPAPFTLTEGETYRVVFDGAEYKLVCYDLDGMPILMSTDLTENGEAVNDTFFVIATPAESDVVAFESYVSYEADSLPSHTIGIWKVTRYATLDDVHSYVEEYISSALEGDY